MSSPSCLRLRFAYHRSHLLYISSFRGSYRPAPASRRKMTAVPTTQLQALKEYTACDIADALLKLKVPGSGYLPDLSIYPAHAVAEKEEIVIAPASTVLFVPKNASDTSRYGSANIPSGKHWVDLTKPGTIVVLSQPEGQKNAVLGGIMALRMKVLGAHGVIVSGRVRDMVELEATGLPVWARGSSAVGAGAESSPYAIEVPLVIDGTEVSPGDLVFSDRTNGVIVIPKDKVDAVVEMLPKIVGADDRVKEEVQNGITVQEAFKKHRG